MKSFVVYFHGKINVEAEDCDDACGQAYDKLHEACVGEFFIDSEEDEGEVEEEEDETTEQKVVPEDERIRQLNLELEVSLPAIKIIDKNTLKIKTSDWQGQHEHTITRQDFYNYIRCESGSMSGLRSLGSVDGDWRMIDSIAQDVAGVFKKIDEVR
jgi:hypothetical protein